MDRLREQRREVDLMGDNLLAVVKQQKVRCQSPRFAKYVAPSRLLVTLRKEYRCTLKVKSIRDFLNLRTKLKHSKFAYKYWTKNSTRIKMPFTPASQVLLTHKTMTE